MHLPAGAIDRSVTRLGTARTNSAMERLYDKPAMVRVDRPPPVHCPAFDDPSCVRIDARLEHAEPAVTLASSSQPALLSTRTMGNCLLRGCFLVDRLSCVPRGGRQIRSRSAPVSLPAPYARLRGCLPHPWSRCEPRHRVSPPYRSLRARRAARALYSAG